MDIRLSEQNHDALVMGISALVVALKSLYVTIVFVVGTLLSVFWFVLAWLEFHKIVWI
jgi:hypothetical protein